MLRSELLERIDAIKLDVTNNVDPERIIVKLGDLARDISLDGILDVQAPEEIARDLKLPRPAEHKLKGAD